MRNERLQKVRREKSASNSDFATDNQGGHSGISNNSPKFLSDDVNFRTLGPISNDQDDDEAEIFKQQTADFSNRKNLRNIKHYIGLRQQDKRINGDNVDIAKEIIGTSQDYLMKNNKSFSSISQQDEDEKYIQVYKGTCIFRNR